jgi:hypothetical protein
MVHLMRRLSNLEWDEVGVPDVEDSASGGRPD